MHRKTRFARLRCVFSVCVPNNYELPATSPATSRQKRVRTDPTAGTAAIDLTTPASTPKTNRSPTKSAIQALEGATESLPTSLHPSSYTSATNLFLYVPNESQKKTLPSE